MNRGYLERYLAGFKESEPCYPFGPEALVYKIKGRMFALVAQDDVPPRLTLKCHPADGAILTGQYRSIRPGYHMNKKHWITITLDDEVQDELIEFLAQESYRLVVAKLPRSERAGLV